MNRLVSLSGIVLALGAAASASAGITIASSQVAYQAALEGRGFLSESFTGAALNEPAGGAGWNSWSADAPGGLYLMGGVLSTAVADDALTISFGSGQVGAVGGIFYLTNANRSIVVGSLIEIALDNGEQYVSESSSTNFAGFIADPGQTISSITIKPLIPGGDAPYAAVSELIVSGVPAPGSLALLGAAGLAARRKRR